MEGEMTVSPSNKKVTDLLGVIKQANDDLKRLRLDCDHEYRTDPFGFVESEFKKSDSYLPIIGYNTSVTLTCSKCLNEHSVSVTKTCPYCMSAIRSERDITMDFMERHFGSGAKVGYVTYLHHCTGEQCGFEAIEMREFQMDQWLEKLRA